MNDSRPTLTDFDDNSEPEYIEAATVEEFVHKTNISDQQVLDRVLLPGREFGPYRILGFVASGGMGEIYAATRANKDGVQSRPLALKVINPSHSGDWRIAERFKREASISQAIRSPNVIRVYEYGDRENKPYLAMELLRGEELFERLCRVHTISLDVLTDLALQILQGLGDIHRSGFIHRDIKPENIFIAKQPGGREVAKILDFGIAKRRDERSDPLLSVVGQIYGTPEYLAPEQANHPDVDPRADLYSVGVMLYEAATGSLPFNGDTSYSVIAAHQNEPIPAMPSSIDPAFAEIVYRAMAKYPNDRFQSAQEMAQVLGRWRDETSWVDGLPGEDSLSFEDVFSTQDFAPKVTPQPVQRDTIPMPPEELGQPTPPGATNPKGPGLEKLSVSKQRERKLRRMRTKLQTDHTTELKRAQGSGEWKPKSTPALAAASRMAPAPATTAPDVQSSARGAQIARVVTWLAVALIVAAVALAFLM
ncbi:serine/threonine-protein kinase [Bradymonas sediminis]|uniref:Protein kinase domain-containing protein n=1 Tax=Bradymonas sediminis TaxID=1548548 RepID=A0A2Z4FGJ4_9DELT|nr:serine/threonine-protein kinase [Bradymonas sediminis]AWV87815.1 hypothetical protein DN745_00080 [Bradymonas sediminis]TDP73908.1 serine/threonine protein kinase [Bradymonas sediminis]